MVMYLGQVAEIGPSDALFREAAHPYTRALLSSMPSMDPDHRTEVAPLAGDPPNPIDPPSGCRFHPRCAMAAPVCGQRVPMNTRVKGEHVVACLVHEAGSGHPLAPIPSPSPI
jgi:peptide/nickel transport system ATP-binding protein